MKRFFVLFLTALFLFLPNAYAAEEAQTRTITTDGTAKVWISPDRARLFFGVETVSGDVDVARNENAKKIKSVLDAIEALKIKDMLIKAPSYNVSLIKEPEYEATRMGRLPKVIGYKVQQEFTVLLKNDDMMTLSSDSSLLLDTAIDSGVNIVQQVNFFKENTDAEKKEAIKLALENAMDNAKNIAETAGVEIKNYSQIGTSTNYWRPPVFDQSRMVQALGAGAPESADTTLVAGKISISAQVHLECEIE